MLAKTTQGLTRFTNLKLFRKSDTLPDMNIDYAGIPSISHMDLIAIELHEMYQSLKRGGFTEKEATHIVGMTVAFGAMLPNKEMEDSPEATPMDLEDPDDGLDLL
jgi:hypothetical protein